MRELPLTFDGKGEVKDFLFTQLKRSNFGYIYEVFAFSDTRWYEVFTRKENTRFDTITYPNSKSFGMWAWTCRTLKRAEEILHEIDESHYKLSLKRIVKKLEADV